MHNELKPLASMYHCYVEADGRSEDQKDSEGKKSVKSQVNLSQVNPKTHAVGSCHGSSHSTSTMGRRLP